MALLYSSYCEIVLCVCDPNVLTSVLDFNQSKSEIHCTQDGEKNQHEREEHYFRLEASREDI